MKTIWKYRVSLSHSQFSIEMPKGARLLSVQVQGGHPQLWALVDSEVEQESRQFLMAGTGHQGPGSGWDHVGTFQLFKGGFVGHLFVQTARESSEAPLEQEG